MKKVHICQQCIFTFVDLFIFVDKIIWRFVIFGDIVTFIDFFTFVNVAHMRQQFLGNIKLVSVQYSIWRTSVLITAVFKPYKSAYASNGEVKTGTKEYYCDVCAKQLNGPKPYGAHMMSKAHKEELELQAEYARDQSWWSQRSNLTISLIQRSLRLNDTHDSVLTLELVVFYPRDIFKTVPRNDPASPDGWAVWGVVVSTRWWLLVDHCVLRNWDRILVRAVKGLISRAGMVSICPLLWQRDVKLQQTKHPRNDPFSPIIWCPCIRGTAVLFNPLCLATGQEVHYYVFII